MSLTGEQFTKEKIDQELLKKRDILSWHGIPQPIAAVLLEQSQTGKMCAARGNEEDRPASQLYVRSIGDAKLRPFFPKPGTVKAKTGNRFPTNGVISEDLMLSKVVMGADNQWHIKERSKTDLPDSVKKVQHAIPLQELIDKVNHNECKVISTPHELIQGIIKFQNITNDIPEDAKGIIFSVNISSEKMKNIQFKNSSDINAMLNDMKPFMAEYCPVFYKKPAEDSFQKVMIYGFPNHEGVIAPITGDIDQLIMGFKSDWVTAITKIAPSAIVPINTFSIDGAAHMIRARIDLEKAIYKIEHPAATADDLKTEIKRIIMEMDSNSISKQGMVSPLESLMIDQNNKRFKLSIGELFQHGAEARNPGKQEKLGKSVFFIEGEIHEVNGPKQTADLLLTALDKNIFFDVNPQWDMQYFGPVVQKQMAIEKAGGPPVLPAVKQAYESFARAQPRGVVVGNITDQYTRVKEQASEAVLLNKRNKSTEMQPDDTLKLRK